MAVWKSRQFNCHRIISVYEMGGWEMVLICGWSDARHVSVLHQPIKAGFVELKHNEASVAAAGETSMHWENSGPKQAAWIQTKSPRPGPHPPLTHTHKHYSIHTHLQTLPLLSTHTRSCTHTHTELIVAERFTSSRTAFVVIIKDFCFFFVFPLISWSIKGTAHDFNSWWPCWDCQSFFFFFLSLITQHV